MSGETILVVDDNPVNLKLLHVALRAEGYDVLTAVDGREAMARVAERVPRMILMDLQLPGEDGLQLTRRLKEDPATRAVVIVAVTAYAMKGDEERAHAAGCDGYLAKPIDTRALPGIVAGYLSGSGGKETER